MLGNLQRETDTETEKSIYNDFMRLGDSSTVPTLLKQLNSPHWSLPRYYLKDLSSIPTSTYCVVSSLLAAVVVPQFGFFLPLFCNTKLTFRPRGPVVPNSAAVIAAAATFVYSRCKVVVSWNHLVSFCCTVVQSNEGTTKFWPSPNLSTNNSNLDCCATLWLIERLKSNHY